MKSGSIGFVPRRAADAEERLTVTVGGVEAGEAVIRYDRGTARVSAVMDLRRIPGAPERLPQFHVEFAEELMAFVLDRGAMAEGEEGAVTYRLGTRAQSLPLPTHEQVGLGYPNSL